MKLSEYKSYLKGLDELAERVKLFAHYSHEMYPFNIYYQCGNLDYEQVVECLFKITNATNNDSNNKHFDVLAKGIVDYDGACYSRRDADIIIKVPNIMYSHVGISKIAHEAMHATILLSKQIGLKLSYKGQEAWCYLLDDIVEKYFIFQRDAIEVFLKSPKRTQLSFHRF